MADEPPAASMPSVSTRPSRRQRAALGGGRRHPSSLIAAVPVRAARWRSEGMSTRLKFFSSSVGTKILIACTGLALFLFLVAHLIGNLLLFAGPETFNGYSHKLISNPLIYVAEAGLIVLFVLHVFKAVTNWASNRSARPAGYAEKQNAGHTSRKSLASSWMIWTGAVTFVFLILHLMTFKFGTWYEVEHHGVVMRDLYRLTLEVFRDPIYTWGYVACMVLLFLHLRHGLSSAMQSLGVNHPKYNRGILRAGTIIAIIIGAGFSVVPLVIFFSGGRS
jgi:succinate dehydrogenase / fumarate reductase cytochrome b subunit